MTDRPTPPTLQQLLHELTAPYTHMDQPLYFHYYEDSSTGPGSAYRCVVTGVSVRQVDGRPVQSLEFEYVNDRGEIM